MDIATPTAAAFAAAPGARNFSPGRNRVMTIRTNVLLAFLVFFCLCAVTAGAEPNEPAAKPQAGAMRLSGPYTHENLTVFLIHGPSAIKEQYLTLEEALKQKKVIVHETGN